VDGSSGGSGSKKFKQLDRSGESIMSGQNESTYYFVPHPSRHPIMAATGLLIAMISLASWVNGEPWAPYTFVIGLLWLLYTLWHWFGDSIGES
jgi:cytochrome c oxidase subunit 3